MFTLSVSYVFVISVIVSLSVFLLSHRTGMRFRKKDAILMYMLIASPMATNCDRVSYSLFIPSTHVDDCLCQRMQYRCKENQIVVPPELNTPNPSRNHAEND